MTASERVKFLGGKSITQIAKDWGTTRQALHYQYTTNPKKFDIIVLGVLSVNEKESEINGVSDEQGN